MHNLAQAHLYNVRVQGRKTTTVRYKTAPIDLSLSQNTKNCWDIFVGLALAAFGAG
jgi:hypothetical protein